MLHKCSPKEMLQKVQLHNTEDYSGQKIIIAQTKPHANEGGTKRHTRISSDHEDVVKVSPPIFIEVSGE